MGLNNLLSLFPNSGRSIEVNPQVGFLLNVTFHVVSVRNEYTEEGIEITGKGNVANINNRQPIK